MASKEREYLDADWLLGDDSSPKAVWASLWSGTVFCLFLAGVAVWSWPYASRWYLQRQYASSLRNAASPDIAIESLTGLQRLLPESAPDMVNGLCAEDDETNRLAHQLLDEFVDQAQKQPTTKHKTAIQIVLLAVDRSKSRCSANGKSFAKMLVNKILQASSLEEDPISLWTTKRAESMLVELDQNEVLLGQEDGTFSEDSSDARIDSIPQNQLRATTRMSLSDLSEPSLPQEEVIDAATEMVEPKRIPSISMRLRSDDPPQGNTETKPLGNSTRLSISNPLGNSNIDSNTSSPELIHPVHVAKQKVSEIKATSKGIRGFGSTVIQAIEGNENGDASNLQASSVRSSESRSEDSDQERSRSEPQRDDPRMDQEIATAIAGLETFHEGDVVRLLTSAQSKIVNAAFVELQRRGWAKEQLELAVELAQGSTRQRIDCMERLVRAVEIAPIPWLVWMAKDGDRDVRYRAIALLGAQGDGDALRQLRLLLGRENDHQIRDQIQHVLLSAGSNDGRRASLR